MHSATLAVEVETVVKLQVTSVGFSRIMCTLRRKNQEPHSARKLQCIFTSEEGGGARCPSNLQRTWYARDVFPISRLSGLDNCNLHRQKESTSESQLPGATTGEVEPFIILPHW